MSFIKSLFRYPVKSLGRQSLNSVQLTDYGLAFDRHWMLVDDKHDMITQREIPQLTNYSAAVIDDSLIITNNTTKANHKIAVSDMTDEAVNTTVWKSDVKASKVSLQMNEWLSDELHTQLILVGAGKNYQRTKETDHYSMPLKFSDGYPILVLSQASVDHLNKKLETSIDESRFRANIFIDGCPPHTEDVSTYMSTQEAAIELIKPCKRCIVVCTNQITGEVLKEPLKTLATYRTQENHVMFGVNARASKLGIVSVKDELDISL